MYVVCIRTQHDNLMQIIECVFICNYNFDTSDPLPHSHPGYAIAHVFAFFERIWLLVLFENAVVKGQVQEKHKKIRRLHMDLY